MIYKTLLLILTLAISSQCAKLELISISTIDQQIEQRQDVPLSHDHPFSCDLVFFTIHDNKFTINITELPDEIRNLWINLTMKDDYQYNNETGALKNMKNIQFFIDLRNQSWAHSYQAIMQFTLSYITIQDQQLKEKVQERKAFMLLCQNGETRYIVKIPKITIAITQAIGLAIILIIPWNIQYRKFLPFTYNIITCIVQLIVLFAAYYIQLIFGNSSIVYDAQKYFVGALQLICLFIYSQDLIMIVSDSNKIASSLALSFSLIILGLDYFMAEVQDAWFLNNVIAIMIAGAFIKFIIIRKFKSAIWGLIFMWIFCFLRQFAKQIGILKLDQSLNLRTISLYLQLPAFWDNQSSLTCSAFSCGKIIAFGVILNFCKRVDLYLSGKFYRICISILAIFCIGVQLLCNIIFESMPNIQLISIMMFYPLTAFIMLFFANKRGEWAVIWDGSFYDMAVNRASINRRISFQDLESSFGRDLLTNSSVTNQNRDSKGFNSRPQISIDRRASQTNIGPKKAQVNIQRTKSSQQLQK